MNARLVLIHIFFFFLSEVDADLNQTFEKLSLHHSLKVSSNPAEDTLEEIDILETYGYKTASKGKL